MTAFLLKKQGWDVIGVSLKLPIWKDKKNLLRENVCCTTESINTAQDLCKKLNIPFYTLDVKKDFKKEVVDYFVSELKQKRTPNPCIICNQKLKFKKLFEFAKKYKIKYVATGHYARIKRLLDYKSTRVLKYQLLKAKDQTKDQTYALSFLPQKWLKYLVFPLEDYLKTEVYQLALQEGFDFFVKRKQSQDFCFVAGKSLKPFLEKNLGRKKGTITDEKGKKLGQHQGLHFYTIGQRKGINISQGPWFVKNLDKKNNILIVTKKQQELTKKEVFLSPFNFLTKPPRGKIKVTAKIRSRHPEQPATLYPSKNNQLKLIFNQPQRAITPGQFAVFYQKNICLGAGKITS